MTAPTPPPAIADVLMGLMVTALTGNTAAANQVFAPRDWPTTPLETPNLQLQPPFEHKESLGRSGAQQFTTTVTIRVIGRMTARAQTGDAGAGALLSALGILQAQIQVAMINSYAITQEIQQIAAVDVKKEVSSAAEQHLGELTMDFHFETYEGPEDFAPIVANPLEQMAIYGDLVNVFDATATFDPSLEPFDAANPAPRTSGPDGRPEFSLLIDLPQP